MLLDDSVHGLGHFGGKPDLGALSANERRDVLEFIKLIAPGLLVGNDFALQAAAAFSAHSWLIHNLLSRPRIDPYGWIIAVDNNNISTGAIKGELSYTR